MTGTFHLIDTDDVEAVLAVKMTVREWKMLRDSLRKAPFHGVAERFISLIKHTVDLAEAKFEATPTVGPDTRT